MLINEGLQWPVKHRKKRADPSVGLVQQMEKLVVRDMIQELNMEMKG